MTQVLEGNVKWFSSQKGYGFIKSEDDTDYFVHHSDIDSEGYRSLSEGDSVTFSIEESEKGPRATNVKLVQAQIS